MGENFKSTGWLYVRDKSRLLSRRPGLYLKPVVIWVATLVSLLVSTYTILTWLEPNSFCYLLLVYLFLVFCYTAIQSTIIERYEIRSQREVESFSIIHELVHIFRDYRSTKIRYGSTEGSDGDCVYDEEKIVQAIDQVCEKLLSSYLEDRHGNVTLTIKYFINDNGVQVMTSRRYGKGAASRLTDFETLDGCHIYKVLDETKEPILYVHDTENENELRRVVGDCHASIRHRAHTQGYRSFFAMPIRTGNQNKNSPSPVVKIPLGFLGCDHALANGISMGELPDHELAFLSAMVDSLSELLFDLKIAQLQSSGVK